MSVIFGSLTNRLDMGRGVRQGTITNHFKNMLHNILEDKKGLSIGKKSVNCIRFVDGNSGK